MRSAHRFLAAGVVGFLATAGTADAAGPYTLSLSGPASATTGQPIGLQASGANPPDDYPLWLDVHAIPAGVVSSCPAGYLTSAQMAADLEAQGGDWIAFAQREAVDAAGSFAMPLVWSPKQPGRFLLCGYTHDGMSVTLATSTLPVDVTASAPPSAATTPGTGSAPPVREGSDAAEAPAPIVITHSYRASRRFTRFTVLKVAGVPAGARLVATCTYRRKRCPGKARRSVTTRRAAGTVSLARFTRVRLRPGAVITVKVTSADTSPATKRITIRRGAPRVS